MNEQQLNQLITNIALLHQELQKQSSEALTLQHEGIKHLESQLQDVNRMIRDEIANQLGSVSNEFRHEISEGGRQGLTDFIHQTEHLKQRIDSFSQSVSTIEKRLEHASRSTLIKIGYLSMFALLCVIGSALWLGMYYGKIINEKRISIENLEMYQKADIVKCGKQLCARVEKNTQPELKQQGYMLIKIK